MQSSDEEQPEERHADEEHEGEDYYHGLHPRTSRPQREGRPAARPPRQERRKGQRELAEGHGLQEDVRQRPIRGPRMAVAARSR